MDLVGSRRERLTTRSSSQRQRQGWLRCWLFRDAQTAANGVDVRCAMGTFTNGDPFNAAIVVANYQVAGRPTVGLAIQPIIKSCVACLIPTHRWSTRCMTRTRHSPTVRWSEQQTSLHVHPVPSRRPSRETRSAPVRSNRLVAGGSGVEVQEEQEVLAAATRQPPASLPRRDHFKTIQTPRPQPRRCRRAPST